MQRIKHYASQWLLLQCTIHTKIWKSPYNLQMFTNFKYINEHILCLANTNQVSTLIMVTYTLRITVKRFHMENMHVSQLWSVICVATSKVTRSSAVAEGPRRRVMSVEILSTDAQRYEKSSLKKLAIDDWPWGSLKVIRNAAISHVTSY